ncbi:MAG TPA: CDP-diacylglycerol--glycerol-3-phosphate 3-phosphatidyltransferase [Gammaproteobacteria bacterium]|jgi:CDP-diacylglycerol--glycerol-3-phosphate 3-phosphatidyltransferase|nr:CDP-diacylglycerol--glycerol-3-phosphate 3-phosphatidyltransferase [Gammaproteobacteria bacterium]
MRFNLPNALTWFRIVAIPLVVIVFYWPAPWARPAAGLLFALAGITDYLDGYLARRLGLTSNFGAFLDPVADKLIVATALVLLVEADPRPVIAIAAAIVIGREITVSALREWMSQIGARAHVAVSWFGKWKTALQIFGISLMLYRDPAFGQPVYAIGEWLLYAAVALTLWSMIDYLRAAGPAMRANE